MKNLSHSFVLFCSLIFLIGFSGCKQNSEIIPSGEFTPYISAYTGGVIPQTGTIRIELTQEMSAVDLYTEIKNNPFRFSPSLKGKASWVNNKTIEFTPEQNALKSGTLYKATFNLGKFVDVPKELDKFEFTFRVAEPDYALYLNEIDIQEDDPEKVVLTGEIYFNNTIDRKTVEKMLSVQTSDKQNLTINVNGSGDSDRYGFSIHAIQRSKKDIELKLMVDGKSFGFSEKSERTVLIPSIGNFRVLSADQIADPESGVQIVFSYPLSETQDLKGLIVIPELSSYVFQINSNKVNVYFTSSSVEDITVRVNEGIKSIHNEVLSTSSIFSFSGQVLLPQVKLLSSGTIIPDSKNLIIPFQAVSLRAVDVSIVRVFENNMLMFLQSNSLSSADELRRAGRLVYKKTLRLDEKPNVNLHQWNDYSIDLSELIKQEPGALYRVELSFKQAYSAYPCSGSSLQQSVDTTEELNELSSGAPTEKDNEKWDIPNAYYSSYYEGVDWSVYDWNETENPCHPTYYMNYQKRVSCNVLASNLGVLVKQNLSNRLWVSVTDILTTMPLAQVDVTAYNYQLQVIGQGKTDSQGFAEISPEGKPFIVVASSGKQKTYLKVKDGEENSTSRFDVGGKLSQKGLKGYIYGERGVWRPGDTLHITFLLEDPEKQIPDKHPVSIELYNPTGQFHSKQISTQGVNGFYSFSLPTGADDPTGLWNAYVKIGGTSFHKSLRIETIKPNRLKINLKLPGDYLDASQSRIPVKLSSSWLTGATASNLNVKVETSLSRINTQFANYSQYIFNNPASDFTISNLDEIETELDANGNANFSIEVPEAGNAPGMLRANITTRVFEPGGDASFQVTTIPFSPFPSYVGINLNQPKGKYIETDKDHIFDIVTVNPEGKPINCSNLEYKIYRIDWSWWWENTRESFESYINNSSITPVASGRLKTLNGKGQFSFRVDYPEWGRYLVYVKDNAGGHATGGTVFVDWPDWRGRSEKVDPSGITMLSFSVDKESYEVDETVTVIIPSAAEGRALVALENGSSVLNREWVQVSKTSDTKYQFKVTESMAPNIYVHISLLQPHAQTVNDLPIRMYGVVPVFITNKQSLLEPQIKMPDVLRPETEFSVSVSEKNGKPMTYTLAVVDDGLLDLTSFKTPDPWAAFYAREALGIRTWDMFDQVVGAYTGNYSSLFSVGGDEMLKAQDPKANRFRPVVKYLGPFTIEKGKSNTHKITLPMYVGSVRTMIVAGQNGAYGNAEKTTPVRSPLMILSTLPRTVSIGEEILLPVNVFAMEESVKNVSVTVETTGKIQATDGNKKSVTFNKPGDSMLYFRMKAGMEPGKEVVTISASGNGETAKETIEIEVRNPNPVVSLHENKMIGKGKTEKLNYEISGKQSDSRIDLEIARIPSVDISRRFDFLYNYEHHCSEQLTSKALPLLFISQLKNIDAKESEMIKKNVQEAIKNLYGRQMPNGGFTYWPGSASENEWITSYVGQFLVTAKEKGYDVNSNVLSKWRSYQRSVVRNWSPSSRESSWHWQSDMQQAYRLYTLALAGWSELGAMNRMKEMKNLSIQAKWLLASAYALDGKKEVANELVFNAQTSVDSYSSDNSVYGSSDRDEAIILETLVLLDRKTDIFTQAQKVSKNLSHESYFSTQSTAFALVAMGRVVEKLSGSIDVEWTINNNKQSDVKTTKAVFQSSIPTSPSKGYVSISNKGEGDIFVDLVVRTQLLKDTLPEIANHIQISVEYLDVNGRTLNTNNLKQGTDFFARVSVSNISGISDYKDLALTHIVPSGWEIYNERMINPDDEDADSGTYTYRDIRDDRILTYFDLERNQKKTFDIRLQAAYVGSFTLPAIQCEAMYDTKVQARTRAGNVEVEK